ncbi:hypothetical protein HS5_14150 [Acidianus sp. HS-5]|nr:hypothetical protein HS5_14150 [Acidianus sp. HS-5]
MNYYVNMAKDGNEKVYIENYRIDIQCYSHLLQTRLPPFMAQLSLQLLWGRNLKTWGMKSLSSVRI